MKSYTTTALCIAFKIWMIALLVNTIADTLLINGFSGDVMEIFLLIGLFGGLFSLPIFIIIWVMVYMFLKGEKSAGYILKWLLFTGISLAAAAWVVFTGSFYLLDGELLRLAIAAPLSGGIAISACYTNIKKACLSRDKENSLFEHFNVAQTAGD